MLPRSLAQQSGAAIPSLVDGCLVAKIPKTMRRNASALVRVAIWNKRAEAQARAALASAELVCSDVRIGGLLKVELVGKSPESFYIRAMTPTQQLLPHSGVALWEWTVVPLQDGEHELSLLATGLGDSLGQTKNYAVHSRSIRLQVTAGDRTEWRQSQAQSAIPSQSEQGQDVASGDRASPAATGKFAAFFNRIKRAVTAEWHPDELLSRHDPSGHIFGPGERTTVLRVELRADGRIATLAVATSSGVDFLDEEALSAFRRAQPFDHPPTDLVDSEGLIRFRFGFIVEPRGRTSFQLKKFRD